MYYCDKSRKEDGLKGITSVNYAVSLSVVLVFIGWCSTNVAEGNEYFMYNAGPKYQPVVNTQFTHPGAEADYLENLAAQYGGASPIQFYRHPFRPIDNFREIPKRPHSRTVLQPFDELQTQHFGGIKQQYGRKPKQHFIGFAPYHNLYKVMIQNFIPDLYKKQNEDLLKGQSDTVLNPGIANKQELPKEQELSKDVRFLIQMSSTSDNVEEQTKMKLPEFEIQEVEEETIKKPKIETGGLHKQRANYTVIPSKDYEQSHLSVNSDQSNSVLWDINLLKNHKVMISENGGHWEWIPKPRKKYIIAQRADEQ